MSARRHDFRAITARYGGQCVVNRNHSEWLGVEGTPVYTHVAAGTTSLLGKAEMATLVRAREGTLAQDPKSPQFRVERVHPCPLPSSRRTYHRPVMRFSAHQRSADIEFKLPSTYEGESHIVIIGCAAEAFASVRGGQCRHN